MPGHVTGLAVHIRTPLTSGNGIGHGGGIELGAGVAMAGAALYVQGIDCRLSSDRMAGGATGHHLPMIMDCPAIVHLCSVAILTGPAHNLRNQRFVGRIGQGGGSGMTVETIILMNAQNIAGRVTANTGFGVSKEGVGAS